MSDGSSTRNPIVGDRIRLVCMNDPSGLEPGNEGTIVYIGEVCAADIEGSPRLKHLMGRRRYWVEWDSGGKLALIEGVDKFEIISDRRKR